MLNAGDLKNIERYYQYLSETYKDKNSKSLSILLLEAIDNQDMPQVVSILEYARRNGLVKEIFCDLNENELTRDHLHHAIKTKNLSLICSVSYILYEYTGNELRNLMLSTDEFGMMPLQYAAQTGDYEIFRIIAWMLGDGFEIALKTFGANKSAISLVPQDGSESSKRIINDMMMSIQMTETIKGIKQEISIVEVLEEYKDLIANNPSLEANLKSGVKIANAVRQMIDYSPNHPATNALSKDERGILENQIDKLSKLPCKEKINHIKKNKVATCEGYSFLVHDVCNTQGIPDEIFGMEEYDHVFNVIGLDPKLRKKPFTAWNADAVVIDAFTGEVFPACDIPRKLRGFDYIEHSDGKITNFTMPCDYTDIAPYFVRDLPRVSNQGLFNNVNQNNQQETPTLTPYEEMDINSILKLSKNNV